MEKYFIVVYWNFGTKTLSYPKLHNVLYLYPEYIYYFYIIGYNIYIIELMHILCYGNNVPGDFLWLVGDLDSSMVETVVGIISGLILLLGIVTGLIIWMRRSGRSFPSTLHFTSSSAFPFWRTTPWSSVPTHIVTQSNPTTEGVKVCSLLGPLRSKVRIHSCQTRRAPCRQKSWLYVPKYYSL